MTITTNDHGLKQTLLAHQTPCFKMFEAYLAGTPNTMFEEKVLGRGLPPFEDFIDVLPRESDCTGALSCHCNATIKNN